MRGFRWLCCVLLAVCGTTAEGWRPGDHPAEVIRPVAGLTRPVRMVAIAAEVSGRISDPGPAVGSVIASSAVVLDDRLAQLDRATNAAAVAQADADSAYRERESQRIVRLFVDGRVSEGERDAAAHAARTAALALDRAKAELARSDELLARHRIALPEGWRVLRRLREVGAVVQPGEPVLEIGDLSAVVATLHLSEDEITVLANAQVLFGGLPVAVRAIRTTEYADAQSRKRPVDIELPGSVGGGREVLVMLRLPDPSGALIVPAALVRADLDGRFVQASDGRSLAVTILRTLPDGMLAVLPDAALAGSTLVAQATAP